MGYYTLKDLDPKNRAAAVRGATEERGKGHVRRLCGIAGISPKHYYSCLKGPGRRAMSDKALGKVARRLQEEHWNALGYRPMAVLVSQEAGEAVNCKRMLRIMREEGILSSVRRRKYTEEVYAERRKLDAMRTLN